MWFANILCFHPLHRAPHRAKVFNFDEDSMSVLSFMYCAFCVKSKNSLPHPKFVMFSVKVLVILHFSV